MSNIARSLTSAAPRIVHFEQIWLSLRRVGILFLFYSGYEDFTFCIEMQPAHPSDVVYSQSGKVLAENDAGVALKRPKNISLISAAHEKHTHTKSVVWS